MNARLFVGNVAYNVDEKGLTDACRQLGVNVENVKIAYDKDTKRPRGFAFVEVAEGAAVDAIEHLQSAMVGGRPLRVERATRQPDEDRRPRTGGGDHQHHGDHRAGTADRKRDEEPWREERRQARGRR
jgi:RNA recognition motif-containing protein